MKNKFTTLQKRFLSYLESGEFAKCTGELVKFGKKYDRFCAMGVACEAIGLKCNDDGLYEYNGHRSGYEMPGAPGRNFSSLAVVERPVAGVEHH